MIGHDTEHPERVGHLSSIEGIHASLIPGVTLPEGTSTTDREDPYWDRLWAPGSQAHWATSATLRARAHAQIQDTGRSDLDPSLYTAPEMVELTGHRDFRTGLDMLAVADAWRTITTAQAAALTGDTRLEDPHLEVVRRMFAAGLMDIGSFPDPFDTARARIIRPGRTIRFNALAPHLTWPEWVSVTGGHPWPGPGMYDRHNILAAEVALRMAEFGEVATLVGEKFSTMDLLAGTGAGRRPITNSTRRSDGTIVLGTGLKVALEITATDSIGLKKKVAAWAKLLRDSPLDATGLVVLFVAAPHPDRVEHRDDPAAKVRQAIVEAIGSYPGLGRNDPARRIGFVHWREWFPARHEISERFLDTHCWFPTGRGLERWQPGRLDEVELDPDYDLAEMVDGISVLASTPHWLRTGTASTILGDPMTRAGIELPVPPVARPNRTPEVAIEPQLPERLR